MTIVRARTVVTMAGGPPLENGAVAIEGKVISDVAPFNWIKAKYGGQVIDLGERALLPGLINAHCHLDYTCLRDKMPRQLSFTEWIRVINAWKAHLTPSDYVSSINAGFAEARQFGTTSIVNLTAFPELIPQVRARARTWWSAELIDVRAPEKAARMVEQAVEHLQFADARGLAPHAPYTASPDLYRFCQERRSLLTTHLAESHEEMEMFRDRAGFLHDFIRSINPAFAGGGQTPLSYFLNELDTGMPWLIAHLNELTEEDFGLLEDRHPTFGIVHCPRSHGFFGHSPFQFERLQALGFPICLGTDSLASNEDLNIFAEMRAFQSAHPNTSPEEVLAMVTRNTGLPRVGCLRPGYLADLIGVPIDPGAGLFQQIISNVAEPWIMINGVAGTI